MRRTDLLFDRPDELAATGPAEARGVSRDSGRLLVSTVEGHRHASFAELADFLEPGDLLVINRSATLPASLPAQGQLGQFTLNLSTKYGDDLWLAEPRWDPARPGPLPGISKGGKIQAAGIDAHLVSPFPGLPRLWFTQFKGDVGQAMGRYGRPIRYGYLEGAYNLKHYQTVFANVPGSAEMPSAAYPFTRRVIQSLKRRRIKIAGIILHTGVSSLEVETEIVERHSLFPEPYWVPASTARMVNATRANGRRAIAVGTTVVRALESAWDGQEVRTSSGFTRLYVHPGRGVFAVDGLLTGLHDSATSHLAMLYAIAGREAVRESYREAVLERYHWHEFGDSHLLLP
jgi:S-adenosylmethionine:tRNA ribosyltransferase-isomerase